MTVGFVYVVRFGDVILFTFTALGWPYRFFRSYQYVYPFSLLILYRSFLRLGVLS